MEGYFIYFEHLLQIVIILQSTPGCIEAISLRLPSYALLEHFEYLVYFIQNIIKLRGTLGSSEVVKSTID